MKKQKYEKPHTTVTELLNCVRQNYYYRSRVQVDINNLFKFPYLKLYANVGISIHDFLQSVYGFSEVKKSLFSDIFKVKGEADAIENQYLYELKSTDESKFSNKYEEDHYIQGNIYSYILNTEYNYNLTHVVLVYIFRDSLKRDPVSFSIPINKEIAILYLKRSAIILDSVSSRMIPEKIGGTAEKCKYCIYKKYCEKDEIVNIDEKNKVLKATSSFNM